MAHVQRIFAGAIPFFVAGFAACAAGCGSLYPASINGLDDPYAMTIYALAPDTAAGDTSSERVAGIVVLREIGVTDRAMRRHVITELTRSINEDAEPAACFKPRYAMRAREGRRAFEILFSFECNRMSVAGEGNTRAISERAQAAILAVIAQESGTILAP